MKDKVHGTVTSVSFRNPDNGFSVIRVCGEEDTTPVVCVGNMANIREGHSVTLKGEWALHPRYGNQFMVEHFEIVKPISEKAIETLLTSGIISNIGTARAQRIIKKFGTETLDIIENEHGRLCEIEGIGKKIAEKVKKEWDEQRSIRDTMLFLQQLDLTLNTAAKIYETYGEETREKISSNPYALVDDIWGIGFKKADAIAHHFGFDNTSFIRIRAGIVYLMQQALSEGHTYQDYDSLAHQSSELLHVDHEQSIYTIDHLIKNNDIIQEQRRLFLPHAYTTECDISRSLRERIKNRFHADAFSIPEGDIRRWLIKYSKETEWNPSEQQLQVLFAMAQSRITLLTGGPGTGKTTALKSVVDMLYSFGATLKLCAPTGRAAQHLQQVTAHTAQTIHRLLKANPKAGEGMTFQLNRENPLECDALVVDEVSMMDIFLLRSLLSALPSGTRILFVGDHNQLPSVGPGNVLADMIASRVITHVHLSRIFRQAARSRIITASHQILSGEIPVFTNDKNDNCFFIDSPEPLHTQKTICDLVSTRLPAKYGFDPIRDIQVITPMHKGTLGTREINIRIQQLLNPHGDFLQRGGSVFRTGDKVMQLRNNYTLGVYNGDIGTVDSIPDTTSLTVSYHHTQVTYTLKNLDELVHAYCISVHKSQGSEFECVVIPVSTQHFVMLQRNLLYTAVTRAKKLCVLVGTKKALAIAIKNNTVVQRFTSLAERLRA